MGGILSNLKEQAGKLKAQARVLVIAYGDKRTPVLAKLLIGLTVAYLLSPIDLIPDFIPVLGIMDDLILVPILIRWSLRLIPAQVLEDAERYAASNPAGIKKRNWAFAAVIVLVWAFVIYLLARWAIPLVRRRYSGT
jgi:uncharacterized membrane protein YkvA (DUF1232 family)